MASFDSQKLAEWTGGSWINSPAHPIEGFCFDARRMQPGQCFVALSGGVRDGHDFLQQAARGGAVAALVEQPKAIALPQLQVADTLVALGAIGATVRSRFTKPVIAVTGSCGKTSTKEMLRHLLGDKRTHATPGNWNNRIGVPMTLLGLDPALQDFAVIEAGINQPGEMAELGLMIRADLNVLTHIGAAHLERLGSQANIAVEKSLLVGYAAKDSPVILPAEALRYPAYAALAARAIALLPEGGQAPSTPTRAVVVYSLSSVDCGRQRLSLGDQDYTVASPSRGIATNAALAITAARELGLTGDDIRRRIETWRPHGQRGRIESFREQSFYIDCYNANPSSMADALDAFDRSASPDLARYYILGAMNELGPTAAEQHEAIGRLLTLRPQDRVAFVGPGELTRAYARGAGVVAGQVESVESIKSSVADFKGALFLKGSRHFQLEQLLPENIQST